MDTILSNPMAHEDRGPHLRVVTVALLTIALTSFFLRAYVRAYMIKAFGTDDWLMLGATVTFTLYSVCVIRGVHYGTGRHHTDLAASDVKQALEYWFFCYIGYCWTMILSKLSIGMFLLRIVTDHIHVGILYAAMFLNALTGVIYFFVTTFQCRPVSFFWDKTTPVDGSCISIDIIINLAYLYSILNILCDFTFALLPIAIVWHLQMPRRVKLITVPLLSLGCIASAGVVVRLAYVETLRDPDFLHATTDVAIWSTVEAGLAITAACCACMRPLLSVIFRRLDQESRSSLIRPFTKESREKLRQTPTPDTIESADSAQAQRNGLSRLRNFV